MNQRRAQFESEELVIAGTTIERGSRVRVDVPLGRLPTQTELSMRVEVVHGEQPGPRVWISGAIHGDELNGVEIVRQVFEDVSPSNLTGSLIAVPIVNVYGFIQQSRYLPDRRDLNRSFPGTGRGSLAARVANLFMTEVVKKCDYGIDLHTAAQGRYNLPHVRGDLRNEEIRRCAEAFSAPVYFHAPGVDGTIRKAANKLGIPVILYEGGEAGRFDRDAIAIGVDGTLRVLHSLHMLEEAPAPTPTVEAAGSTWIRARRAGLLRLHFQPGDRVKKGQRLGTIGDALGDEAIVLKAPCNGIVISHATNPLLNLGDAVVHLAKT